MRWALVVILVLIGAACGGDDAAPVATVAGQLAAPERIETAQDVVEALRAAGLPVGNMVVYTAETDPNTLLGRPNGYAGKVAFVDERIKDTDPTDEFDITNGGSVEWFATHEAAVARSEYIQAFGKGLPTLVEYNYIAGPVLLRLSQALTPEQAAAYETALKDLDI